MFYPNCDLFFRDEFEKMQHGSEEVVAELYACVARVRQHLHLRVKEDNFTKEKYVNTAKERFASSPFNVGSISAALSCLVYPPGQRLLIKPTFNETLAEMQM